LSIATRKERKLSLLFGHYYRTVDVLRKEGNKRPMDKLSKSRSLLLDSVQ